MPNPTDTLYAPPLPPLGQPTWVGKTSPPPYFDDVVAKPALVTKPTFAHPLDIAPQRRVIDEDEARFALLKTLVAFPNRVNPRGVSGTSGCVYTSEANESHHCIAGQVLSELGVPLPNTTQYENGSGISTLAGWLRDVHGISLTPDAQELLGAAQNAADGQSNAPDPQGWAVAVGRAITRRNLSY